MIAVLDLKEQFEALRDEITGAAEAVFRSGHFINGPNVEAFERELAAYVGTRYAVGLNSGTDALHLALRALDIGPGDEVITTPFTFVATTEAIGIVGATPVFVDIDPATFNIDENLIEAAITERTKAIVPVHLYGAPASMERTLEVANKHGIRVVEDCAQAIGAEYRGKRAGSLGDAGCFSFFPSKNLGAYGDGGMVTTDSLELAQRIRSLRAHGGRVKYHHEELGVNSRLDELQAAFLRVKLRYLDRWNAERRRLAARYTERLKSSPAIAVPHEASDVTNVYHQYTIRVAGRDRVREQLRSAGVDSMVYYPVPLHLQRVHRGLALEAGSFPVAETAAAEVLSLPMYPELGTERQETVIGALNRIVEGTPRAQQLGSLV